jgi:ectoine hydroxylase-related dioxygenase (phytanoyl-CoA dioxygenase family)
METLAKAIFTDDQLNQWDQLGYVIVEDALSSEKVAQLMQVIDSLRSRLERAAHRRDIFGLDIRPLVTEDDAFLEVMEWPTTFPLAVRLLQHYNIQLMTSHLIMVPPNPNERNISWHRDGGAPGLFVAGIPALFSLKIGYFLTDLIEPHMGQLMVVPGSHKRTVQEVFSPGQTEPDGGIELRVKAGSAVIFHQGLYHAGGLNLSDKTRTVLYYGYGYRLMRPIDYTEMPAALLERCSPITRQLLGAKVTHLGYQIPTEADVPLRQWYLDHYGPTWREE